ncbi:MAG TPA: glycosyltransferase [Azospirillaceae bacterium]|nr:glycosyltransferase [Azospirillaceae bacterium]
MKVALVHYWLVTMRGGEKVLEELCRLFPEADIFTHVVDRDALSPTLLRHDIKTSFIQNLPKARTQYQKYLPLMPMALEHLDLRGYDLVISSEAGPAKGVITDPEAVHVCYCHSPMRYVWNMYHDYRSSLGGVAAKALVPVAHYLRWWDALTATRVDEFVANSGNVAKRIQRYYGRGSEVVYPPVAVDDFTPTRDHDGFYLLAGQLVGYKRADLAVEAFNRSGRPLVVIGAGEQLEQLRHMAKPNVTILGPQPFSSLRDHYARCRALIFPGEEDFGIVPVEAMASGKPVIAYGKGGALETVVEGRTGLFFRQQTVDDLNEAVTRFEATERRFSADEIALRARAFDASVFREDMQAVIGRALAKGQLPGVEFPKIPASAAE